MKDQACEPCAKRKVRCDKGEPCSNCKRRKQDYCSYPEASPYDKIKKLEALIRKLGGDPENDAQHAEKPTEPNVTPAESQLQSHRNNYETARVIKAKSKDSVILEEDGHPFYLESRAWQGWFGTGQDDEVTRDTTARNPFMTRKAPNALQGILCSNSSVPLATRCPSQQDAIILWDAFYKRIHPVLRIAFSWTLKPLHSASIHPEGQKQLTDAEHTLIFSLYLLSVVSLSDEECAREMHQPKSLLLSEYQMLCEEAMSRTNLLCISDIVVLKPLTVYIMAGIDRLSTQSLWSLMGVAIRNAEKLGIHRDGALLGLSPIETEERRRLWWQLQHLDLALAVRSGLTPLTLMAEWDAKLPLNIEDDDINASMTDFPEERKGLTSMSWCLYTYWVIDQQRLLCCDKGRFELSWQSNQSRPFPSKESLLDQLESGLNKNFLQYCDPIRPLDTLIQLSARSLICGMRQRALHPLVFGVDRGNTREELRDAHTSACMQCLEYNVAIRSQPNIRYFHWLTEAFFPWQPFMCVLIEASQQSDTSKTQRIWDLLSELYSANPTLSQLSADRRRSHAAGIVLAAWKARQKNLNSNQYLPTPEFVTHLETQLSEGARAAQQGSAAQNAEAMPADSVLEAQDFDAIFNLDFQDIDWSFWSSID